MNILVVKLSSLGDVTHTLPALTTLRRHWPEAHLTWLVEPAALDILRGHPALDRIIVWPRPEWVGLVRRFRWVSAGRRLTAFLRELRDTRYDLVLDFQGLAKSALWVLASRSGRKVGGGPGRRRNELAWIAYHQRVAGIDPAAHAVERNLGLLEGIGLARLPLRYDFPISPAARGEAEAMLAGLGPGVSGDFVAVNAMTRWPTKNWTPAGFARLADLLQSQGKPVVFTGAPGDRAALDAIAAVLTTPMHRLDGRTSLPVLAALFSRARVVVSTDTGPMHIAVAMGTPVVALFGPTDPAYTGPYGPTHRVLRAGVPCSPCFKKECRTQWVEEHACMRRLSPEAVAAAVIERWERAGGQGGAAHQGVEPV